MGFYGKLVTENNNISIESLDESINICLEELNMYNGLFTINESIELITEANVKKVLENIAKKISAGINFIIEKFKECIRKVREFISSKHADNMEEEFNKLEKPTSSNNESYLFEADNSTIEIVTYDYAAICKKLEDILVNDTYHLDALIAAADVNGKEEIEKAIESAKICRDSLNEIEEKYEIKINNKFDAYQLLSKNFGTNQYYRKQLKNLYDFSEKAAKKLSITEKRFAKIAIKEKDDITNDILMTSLKNAHIAIDIYNKAASITNKMIRSINYSSLQALKILRKK